MKIVFEDDYGEFLTWLLSSPNSYLINTGKTEKSKYAVLHNTNCPHLKPANEGYNVPKGSSRIKVCSEEISILYGWCRQHRPLISTGFSSLCKDCFPDQESVWQSISTPIALDIKEPSSPQRAYVQAYRIIRDTRVTRAVKSLHRYRCQLCGEVLMLADGRPYAEAHHIQPLGEDGPDILENVICVCPNHHALLDYAAIPLDLAKLRPHGEHKIESIYISYHNRKYESEKSQRQPY